MLKSLYSGVTGMRSQQTKMDVISNNIANVSTTGFKAGRVRFQDLISQIDSPAQGATNNLGGVNPRQIGMGVQVSGTDTIMTGGSLQTTGRSLDFGIEDGDSSFFVVSAGDNSKKQFTRDGVFFTDHNGTLVTSDGYQVHGYAPTNSIEIEEGWSEADFTTQIEGLVTNPENTGKLAIPQYITTAGVAADGEDDDHLKLDGFTIDGTGTITGNYTNVAADGTSSGGKYILGRVAMASFVNPDGLEKAGGNLYNDTANSREPNFGAPTDPGKGRIRAGFLEMSNVDLANEFTEMIVTNRAYQANSRSITTSDEMIQELINLKR